MPNRCTFCTIIKPTNHLILGTTWYEFCESCGEQNKLHRMTEDGSLDVKSVREVFDSLAQERLASS